MVYQNTIYSLGRYQIRGYMLNVPFIKLQKQKIQRLIPSFKKK